MQKITSAADLKNAIIELEYKEAGEWVLLKEQLNYTYESLQPINIIKRTLKEAYSEPNIKTDIITSAIGIATGFVAKKTFLGKTHNPLTKLLGFIVEMVVANKVAKNGDKIKSIGSTILKSIVNKGDETGNV